MTMNQYTTVIAGGGPIGGHIASTIAKAGHSVALIEEHHTPGAPLKCAGLVTSRVLDFYPRSKTDIIQNTIKGAHIHSPSGKIVTIGGNAVHAYAIDRSRFDAEIINQARKDGADLHLGKKIINAEKTPQGIAVTVQQKKEKTQITCDMVIGADGPHSTIRNTFQFPRPTEILKGIGADLEDTRLDSDFVEIFLGNNIAPGFFAWIIPTNPQGTSARAGLCISPNARHSLKHYFTQFLANPLISPYFSTAQIKQQISGSIPLGPLKKTTKARVMLVGDAAAQVKPTSGGGLYPGLLCAQHCSQVALEALKNKQLQQTFLKKYHKRWTDDIGKELTRGMKFRRIFTALTDKQLDKYLQKINHPQIIDVINTYGDIDYPSKLLKPMIKQAPSLFPLLFHYP